MKKINKTGEEILCLETGEIRNVNSQTADLQLSDIAVKKMIFDLQQHQEELELQNEELIKAKAEADFAIQKYAELYDFAPSVYFTLSREGIIMELNLCGCQMLGNCRSYLKNSLFIDYVSDNKKEDFLEFLGLVFESGVKVSCELTLTINNDTTTYVQLTSVVSEKGGQCLLTAVDITEYKTIEATLTESREFYSDLVSNQSAGIYRILVQHPDTGKSFMDSMSMEFVSNRFCELIEINASTILKDTGTAILNRIHPDEIQEFIRLNEIAQQSLNPFIWNGRLLMDDRIKWVRFESSPRKLENGCIRWTGMVTDITKQITAEQEMRLAHSRLRRFIDSDIVGIVIATSAGILVEANDYYLRMIGYSREEFNSNAVNWRDITPREWLPADDNSILELRKKGSSTPYIKEYLRRDGTRITVMIADTLLPGPEEQIAGFILDITEQKLAEAAVIESESRLNKSQEMAHLGSWDYNIQTGELIWSDEVYRIFGVQPEEFGGTFSAFIETVHPDDKGLVDPYFLDFINKNQDSYEMEHRIIRRHTGEVRIVYEKCQHIRDTSGLIVRSVGMVQDVTELRMATEELKQSEEKYRLLAENISDVIWIFNISQQRFTYISPSVFQLRGFTDAEAMTEDICDSMNSEADLKLNRKIPSRIFEFQNGVRKNYIDQFQQSCKDGGIIWVETVSEYFYAKDGTIEVHGVSRDITQRKRVEAEIELKNEALQKLNAEKDKFFSIIAHDLRSPFSGFLGLTELMAESLQRMTLEEIHKLAFMMRNSAANLFRLLGNLLEWSRMQRGLTSFEPREFLLMPKIAEGMVLVLESAKNKEIEIYFEIKSDFVVFADENMLDSIMRNLGSNAVKFTPKGGSIIFSAISNSNNHVEISIKDTGIGMNRKMIDHLFRLEKSMNRKGTEGEYSTGLGLIICKDFIEKHGGKLWVESEVGKGSTFHFSLPNKRVM